MTAFAIAHSTALGAAPAVEELARKVEEALGDRPPAGGLIWTTAALGAAGAEIGARLGVRWPDAILAGTSFEGLIAGGRTYRGEPAVGLLAWQDGDLCPTTFLLEPEVFVPDDEPPAVRLGETVARAILAETGRNGLGPGDLLLLFPDGHGVSDPEAWLQLAAIELGGPRIAGAAAVGASGSAAASWILDESHPGGLVGLLLPGRDRDAAPRIATSEASRLASPWLAIDGCRGRWIDSLEGESPVDWIRRQLGLADADPIEPHLDRLLVRLADGSPDDLEEAGAGLGLDSYQERYVVGVDERSGAIALPVPVARGRALAFALPDAGHARDRLRSALRGLPDCQVLIQLACRSRDESLHGDLDVESAVVASEQPEGATLGTLSPFQLGPGPGGRPSVLVHTTVLAPLGTKQ